MGDGVLIGRETELQALASAIAAGEPLALLGEAGVGKTTLVRTAVADSGRRLMEGGALATLSWMPFMPVARALGRAVPAGDEVHLAAEVRHAVGDGVLFLDDLHWADRETRRLLPLLVGRLAMVAAIRSGDPTTGNAVAEVKSLGFRVVDVAPLRESEALSLVTGLKPDISPIRASGIVARAGGNPLILEELVEHGQPTSSLRLALAARLRRLTPAARRCMGLLALAGQPMAPTILPNGSRELLESGLAAEAHGGLICRHALLAETLVAEYDEDERRELHASLARILESPGDAARHHDAAGERQHARAAALAAAEATPYAGERARHLELAARCSDGPAADELRLEAARALVEANDYRGVDGLLDAIESNEPLVQSEVNLLRYMALEVAVEYAQARAAWSRGMDLAAGSGSDIETRLRIEAGRIAYMIDSDPRAIEIAEAGDALARSRGRHRTEARFILGSAQLFGRDRRWRRSLEQAVAAARRSGDTSLEYRATNNLVLGLVLAGDLDRAGKVAAQAEARAGKRRLGGWERRMAAWLVGIDWHNGELLRAVARGETLVEDVSEVTDRHHAAIYLGHAIVDLGRHTAARLLVDALLAETAPADTDDQSSSVEEFADALALLAKAELSAGRARAALTAAERARPFYENVSFSDTFFVAPVIEAWARLELNLPIEARSIDVKTPIAQGLSVEIDGVRLLAAGHALAASRRFKAAAALWQRGAFGSFLRCRWAEGEALRRAGRTDDAITVLHEAEHLARQHGYAGIVQRVERSLRLCGVRRTARRATDGVLTARERELLGLVSEGLSNAEIARRLSISRSTVKRTIETAASKLGATSRLQAAALAGSY